MDAKVEAGALSPDFRLETGQIGWQGRTFLRTSGSCPGTVADLLPALQGASFETPGGTQVVSVRVWPAALRGVIETGPVVFANFELKSMELALSDGVLSAPNQLTDNAYEGSFPGVNATIVGGYSAYTLTLLSETEPTEYLLPTTSSVSGAQVSVTRQSATTARIEITGLSFNYPFVSVVAGQKSTLDTTFTGSMIGTIALGCEDVCGYRGTCTAAGTCECDCGWSGPSCDSAEGFCDAPVSFLLPSLASRLPSIDAEGNVVGGPGASTAAPAAAPAPATARLADGSCPAGLRGAECDLCTTDAACAVLRPDVLAPLCDTSLDYQASSQYKEYVCDPASSSVSDFLGPDFSLSCNTTLVDSLPPLPVSPGTEAPLVDVAALNAEDPLLNGGFCRMAFAEATAPDKTVNCLAWGCATTLGSGVVICPRLQCDCPDGCGPLLGAALPTLEGPAQFDCDSAQETCIAKLEGLPIDIEMPCGASECIDPSYTGSAGLEGRYGAEDTTPWDVIIAGLTVWVVAAALLVLLAASASGILTASRTVRTFAARHKGALLLDLEPAATASGEPLAFTFSDITVIAPQRKWYQRKPFSGAQPAGNSRVGARKGIPPPQAVGEAAIDTGERVSQVQLVVASAVTSDGPGSSEAAQSSRPSLDSVPVLESGPRRAIIRGISGTVQAGEIMAILGPSGSGKSSLLAVLSRQPRLLPSGVAIGGSVSVTGEAAAAAADNSEAEGDGGSTAGPRLAFVQQNDTLMASLTVAETVLMSLMLRERGARQDQEGTANRSAALLHELGLTDCSQRLVGGAGGIRGISGGERRRVSIAVELATRPHILVMDEPTSGLDSYTASELVKTLSRMTRRHGRIVIATLHQPSPSVFAMLDRVVLLAPGRAVFSGRTADLQPFLLQAGHGCPEGDAMAEHLLMLVSTPDALEGIQGQHWHSDASADGVSGDGSYKRAAIGAAPFDADALSGKPLRMHCNLGPPTRKGEQPSKLHQLGILVWRGLLDILRNPSLLILTLLMASLLGVFCGLVFWDLDNGISGAQNRAGAFFFCILLMGFFAVTSCDSLIAERDVVNRETGLGWYPSLLYVAAKSILDAALLRVVPTICFATPMYYMAGFQRNTERYLVYVFVLCTFAICVGLVAMTIVAWTRRIGTAMLTFVMFLVLSLLFSGFLANADSINKAVSWVKNISIVSYAYEALAINEFQGNTFEFVVAGYANVGGIKGEVFAESIGLDASKLSQNLVILNFWALGLLIVLMLTTWWKNRRRL